MTYGSFLEEQKMLKNILTSRNRIFFKFEHFYKYDTINCAYKVMGLWI